MPERKTAKPARRTTAKPKAAKRAAPRKAAKPAARARSRKPKLLSGGNPQIAKGYGDEPVQAYLAAIPVAWKRDVARRVDAVVTRTLPGVRKAVKWNSPLYGAGDAEQGWFLGVHMFTNYVKLAFFRGAALRPRPPGESTQEHVRYLDVRDGDAFDEAQLATWVRQASAMPGQRM